MMLDYILLPFSQSRPVLPSGHMHLNVLHLVTHVAPFLQGFGSHGVTAVEIRKQISRIRKAYCIEITARTLKHIDQFYSGKP